MPDPRLILPSDVGLPSPSTRFVTGGDCLMNTGSNSNKFFNVRRRRVARTQIVNPRIIIPNFYMLGGTETAFGAAGSVIGAGIEQNGQTIPFTFGGSAGAANAVPNLGFLVSDPLPNVVVQRGTVFFLRAYLNFPGGMPYRSGPAGNAQNPSAGDAFEYAPTSLTNRSAATGTFTSSDAVNVWEPLLVGDSNEPSLFWLGDSTFEGIGATLYPYDDTGMYAFPQTLAQFFGSFNSGIGSATSQSFMTGVRTNRTALANTYATHLIQGHGLNMLGQTLASMQADLLAERNLFPGLKAYMTTSPPSGNTNDAGATVGGQTPSANESKRTALNDWRRLCPEGWQGCLDIADLFEVNAAGVKTRNGGRYLPGMSADMLHPNSPGYAFARSHGAALRAQFGL